MSSLNRDNIITKIPNINFKQHNLSHYLIFLFIAILIIIIILILRYGFNQIYYMFNQNLINLLDFKKIHMSSSTLVSIVDNPNYQTHALRDFFVKTAYNCCCTSNFKESYVNLGSLEICISQGVRCLDFEIHSLENDPVVAASSLDTYNNTETYNSLPIQDVLNTISQLAFSAGTCSNFNDPLILHFRIMNNNPTMYTNFANIISKSQQFHSLILGKDYSNEYYGKNLGAIPILNFKRKIIICIYGADTFFQSTPLDEYINIASGQAFMHLIRYNDIKYTPDKSLMDFNKKNMSIVLPNPQIKLENPSFNLCREYGCQFIGMSFPNNDINLQQYNLFFNNNKSAFVLKPKELRSSSSLTPGSIPNTPTIPVPTPALAPALAPSTQASVTKCHIEDITSNDEFDAECKTLFGNDWSINGDLIRGNCWPGQKQANCKPISTSTSTPAPAPASQSSVTKCHVNMHGLPGSTDFDDECKIIFGNNWSMDGDPSRGTCTFGYEQANCKQTSAPTTDPTTNPTTVPTTNPTTDPTTVPTTDPTETSPSSVTTCHMDYITNKSVFDDECKTLFGNNWSMDGDPIRGTCSIPGYEQANCKLNP